MKKIITGTVLGAVLLIATLLFTGTHSSIDTPVEPPAPMMLIGNSYPTNPQPLIMSSSMTIRAQVVDADTDISLLERDDDAMLVIETTLEVKIGQLVIIDVSQSTGNNYKWSVMPGTPNFRVFDDGRVAVFSSGTPGDYTFFVSCCAGDELDHKIIVIRVLDKYPTPPAPGPQPPAPEPLDPSAPFAEKLAYWLTDMEANKNDCERLAQSFESVAAQIRAGVIPLDKISAATRESSRTALGHRAEVWGPFMASLKAVMITSSKAGQLETVEQYDHLWLEISKALLKYAGPSDARDIIKASRPLDTNIVTG